MGCQPGLGRATGLNATADFSGGPSVPIGRPFANLRCYVLDAALQLVPIGQAGELMVSGIQLARSYLQHPDLTAEKFIPNPYACGDKHHSRLYRTGARHLQAHACSLAALLQMHGLVLIARAAQATWRAGSLTAPSTS